jgi:hypothetical protein
MRALVDQAALEHTSVLPLCLTMRSFELTTDTTICVSRTHLLLHYCRSRVAPNHTMTHVLNYALRKVLCGGVNSTAVAQGMCDQKGSFVDDEKLRYTNLYLPS